MPPRSRHLIFAGFTIVVTFAVVSFSVTRNAKAVKGRDPTDVRAPQSAAVKPASPGRVEDAVAAVGKIAAQRDVKREVLSFEAFNLGLTRHWLEQARQNVPVSDEELERLAGNIAEAISITGAYELSIARVDATADRIHVDVPPYPAAGRRVAELLKEEFNQAVGAERAENLWSTLEENLSAELSQFGRGRQTIDATVLASSGANPQYKIERRIEWESSEGRKSTTSQLLVSGNTVSDTDYIALAPYLKRLKN